MNLIRPSGIFIAALLALAALAPPARAENWPQWRGPRADGTSLETGVVTEWGKDKNVVWKTDLPGSGHSSPIVWGDRVFLTTALGEGHERQLLCLDAKDGKILWQKTVVNSRKLEAHHQENGFASSTPATDGEGVYTSFYRDGFAVISRFDFKGEKVWETQSVHSDAEHGYSHSPVLHKDAVIVSVDSNDDPAALAFDRKTGKQIWRTPTSKTASSYVTPMLIKTGGRDQLVTCGNNLTRGLDPETGEVIWSCAGPTQYTVAGLAFYPERNLVFANGGYPEKVMMAVRTNGKGDVTVSHKEWEKRKGMTYVPSPVYAKGCFFNLVDNGVVYCLDAGTGEIKWQERACGGHVRTSLVLIEGNLHATNDEGVTVVFKADPDKYVQVAKSELGEFIYATPAVSAGKLYMRTGKELYCFGKK